MITFRHNLDLVWGDGLKKVIAPRYFICNHNTYYVHIEGFNCEYVVIFIRLRYIHSTCVKVALGYKLKLYSNTKGLYFNFSYWINNFEKKTTRIYICE